MSKGGHWILTARKTRHGDTNQEMWVVDAKCSECGAPHPSTYIGGAYPDDCVYALFASSRCPDGEEKQIALDDASRELDSFCHNCGAEMRSVEAEPARISQYTDPNTALWDKLRKHWGHNVRVAFYGDPEDPESVCLECEDCGEVVLDAGLYTLQARNDV